MKSSFLFQAIIIIATLMAAVNGTRAELMVGDKAPKLKTGKWIQGKPVRAFDTNHVYVVEFWATWCGPCVGSIPHLNALWQKFKDKGVIVIGQDIWDSDNAVAPFVKKMGAKMTYRVALDYKSRRDPDGFMSDHWWKRKVNYHGIPTAFIINREGRIAWIGHPMALKEDVLEQIVSGHYDLAKAAVKYKKDWAEDQQFQALQRKLFSALDQKKWNDAESVLNEILKSHPKFQKSFAAIRFKILLGQKRYAEAYKFADSFTDSNPNDADRQNYLAWILVTQEGIEHPDLDLAEKLAECANQSTGSANAEYLDTLARVQFMLGKKQKAITTEEKALNLESNPREKGRLEKTLASYRQGKLPEVKE